MADITRSSPSAANANDALLAPDAVRPAAAAEDGHLAPVASGAQAPPDLDAEFQRPQLGKEKLAGTVGFHQRHVFLCYKGPDEWPSHVEATDSDRLPRLLSAAIEARKSDLKKSTKLTICEGEDGTESPLGDVLIFPDMIRYRGLTHFDVDNFVEEVLVKDGEWLPGSPEAIKGSYVFVCAHESRDKRCGVCVPALITRFKEEIEGQCLNGQVAVSACSYVGGHKYSGNVIIFKSDAKGEVTGHWYGYVAPDDVPVLLHKHIGQGEIVDNLWRGQLGMTEEEQKKTLELKHTTNGLNGEELSAKESDGTDGAACNPAPAGGCCQGNGGGFTCCQSDLPGKQDKSVPAEETETDKESGATSKKFLPPPLLADSCPSSSSPMVETAGVTVLVPESSSSQVVPPIVAIDPDVEFGFQRPEFGKEELAGTVRFHERHMFICYKGPGEWPSAGKSTKFDCLPNLLATAIKARVTDLKKITKLTICEGIESSHGDVLIFPDMIRYRGLTQLDVDNFVEEVLVKDVEWLPGSPEAIKGSYVFVCAHGNRDKRCGVCGPALITRFKEEIEGHGLGGQVAVSACSHVGGHKYAGNVIIFSSHAKGEVTGHWYGYVAPDDVPVLLHKHIGQGQIVDHLWRGQLGMTKEQQKKASELKHTGAVGETSDHRLALVDPMIKLRIPKGFDGDAILSDYDVHSFTYAKELQSVINRTTNWLSGKLSFSLMKNGKLFAVQANSISDSLFQASGAVCVVKIDQLPQVVITTSLYSISTTGDLKEHKADISYVSDKIILKSEFGGGLWCRRKYVIEGDNEYCVLQWRPRTPDNETKQKAKVKASQTQKVAVLAKESDETRSMDDFSIKNCISIANAIEELSVHEKAGAYDIFKSEANREIFVCADRATRLVWLRKQMAIPD